MWLFSSPKNYPEMLRKIATTMFALTLLVVVALSYAFIDVGTFMESISFGSCELFGHELYISYLYFPLMFSISENIFKLHDKISDILGIRFRFDKNVIISSFLTELNLSEKICKVNSKNRDTIMNTLFYKYASSTKPQIDPYLIYMALGAWSWYWIILDTIVLIFAAGVVWLIQSFSWLTFLVLIGIVFLCLMVMKNIKEYQCRKYALLEVQAILELTDSQKDITRYLNNAL